MPSNSTVRMKTRLLIGSLAAYTVALAALLPSIASAQAFPTKPIRIVVPFASGGLTDIVARTAGQKMSGTLGQPVIIDNRPGAAGNIGTALVAKAPSDGYTLLLVSSSFAINPILSRPSPYDPIKDFEPVSGVSSYMLFLAVNPSQSMRSVKALIAQAKVQPGRLTYASSGTGTTTHIAGELFSYMTDVRMTHVAYRGAGSWLPAVMGGEVSMTFGTAVVVPQIKAGKLVALGVTGPKRSPMLPDVPTIAEAGIPGYEVTSWNAMYAPGGTPEAVVKRISTIVQHALRDHDTVVAFERQGIDPAASTPEELSSLTRSEFTKWAKVIKAANIVLE